MLLWEPIFLNPPTFRVNRGTTNMFVIGWQESIFLATGNPTCLLEHDYGGYRFFVRFKSNFWDWSSSMWALGDIFEDVYAIEPTYGNIVNAGAVFVRYGRADPFDQMAIVLDMPALHPTYQFQAFPSPDPGYWAADTRPYRFPLPHTYQP